MVRRVVDEFGYVSLSQFIGPISEHEEHGVDNVGFATPIRTDHGGEALVALRSVENARSATRSTLHHGPCLSFLTYVHLRFSPCGRVRSSASLRRT